MKADRCGWCEGEGTKKYACGDFKFKDTTCHSCFGSGFSITDIHYIVCPYCGYKHDHIEIEIYESNDGFDCHECNQEFRTQVDTSITFNTFRKEI